MPAPIHWSPYAWLQPDRPNPALVRQPAGPHDPPPPYPQTPAHRQMPDLSLRKRLVRLPTGDDALLIGDGSASPTPSLSSTRRQSSTSSSSLSMAPSSVRRNLDREFAAGSVPSTPDSRTAPHTILPTPRAGGADHKHVAPEAKYPQPEVSPPPVRTPPARPAPDRPIGSPAGRERKHSETPPPPRPLPLERPGDPPAALARLLPLHPLGPADCLAAGETLLARADFLSAAEVDTFTQVLAQRVLAAARPAASGMAALVEHLLRPLETRLRHDLLGALTHGLQRACVSLAQAEASPARRRGLGVAMDSLSRHVAQSRERVGLARHAVQTCALARVAGPGQFQPFDGGPQAFGRLLAHNPVAALWHAGTSLNDVERLGLFSAALSMPPGVTSPAQAAQLRDRILAQAPFRLRGVALAHVMDAARWQVSPGCWPMARIDAATFNDMARHMLRVGVAQWVDACEGAVHDADRAAAEALAAIGRDKIAAYVDSPRGRELVFDEEGVSRATDQVLQDRQAEALGDVVDDLVWFFTRFDISREPVFLRGRALWLRQMTPPAVQPEMATVARALADALERHARALSAPPSPDLP